VQHGVGKVCLLVIVHTIQVDGHEQSANLIVGNRAARDAFDKEGDLLARKVIAIAFSANYVLRSQSFPLSLCSANVMQTVTIGAMRSVPPLLLRLCRLMCGRAEPFRKTPFTFLRLRLSILIGGTASEYFQLAGKAEPFRTSSATAVNYYESQ
jgi:hypothetical protein